MARRRTLLLCLGAVAALVLCRGVPFMAPGVRFDADQGVVGLMAKHISEGRAYPLFFYGQTYLLAIEAYLAAPVMWLLGPTEVALELPVLAMNVAAAMLMLWHATRAGLSPSLALIGTLPFALAPIVVGTRLMEAMGGNIETPFYAVLLWTVRRRPWAFAVTAAVAFAHRELVASALVALLLLDLGAARRLTPQLAGRWTLTAVMAAAVQTAIAALRPFAAMFGPGSVARPMDVELTTAQILSSRLCLDPARWPERWTTMVGEHWRVMVGGQPDSLQVAGVNTGMGQGNHGLFPWVAVLVGLSLVAAWRTPRAAADATAADGVPDRAWPWYVLLCGATSTFIYGFASCTTISIITLRYDLLAIFMPAGALMAGLRHPARTVRAALATATLVWAVSTADDYRALAAEIAAGGRPDPRREALLALDARHVEALWGEYRLAYAMTFLAGERITIAATEAHRVDIYADRARAAQASKVNSGPCPGGELLVPGMWLCPP